MKPLIAVILCLVFLCGCMVRPGGDALPSASSFDGDWRFARYGLQADGSRLDEPGALKQRFELSASSEETSKGNVAAAAMDDDPETRWCASGPEGGQWIQIDMGHTQTVAKADIDWETDGTYQCTIEGSTDSNGWKPLPGDARFLRIRITAAPSGKWASIREIRLFDAAGKAIANRMPSASASEPPSEPAFADSAWRNLDLPHDWAIEGPFRYDIEGNTGKLPWQGIGWYRKHFTVPAADADKRLFVDFDGAMANAQVFCNGKLAGDWPYGYASFRVELTPYIKFGGENVLAVRLDTEKWGSRWYPGAGIYRHVRLVKTNPVHAAHWGIFVTTPELTDAMGKVNISVNVENQGDAAARTAVRAEIRELAADGVPGRVVGQSSEQVVVVGPGGSVQTILECTVTKPKRWNLENPARYVARTVVSVADKIVDRQDTPFGFRTFEFKHDDGFHLNGKRVQINGVCNHHDLGALGAAFNRRAAERQLEILKAMGCNAIRTSHNPPAPELLDLADRMGFLVQCEAFDCWTAGKKANDYARLFPQWHKRDLQAMVRHFRNHPSIIMWSTGNEVGEQDSLNPAKELHDIVHAEDPTRPVSAGVWDGAARSDFRFGVDVQGLNYAIGTYSELLAFPGNENRPFYASESSSCISSRGEYFFPVKRGNDSRVNFHISSYDVDAPGWACTPDEEFTVLDQNPGFAGEFVWTGFDYLGEPTPYNNDMSNLLNIHDKDPAKMAAMKKELEELGKIRVPSRSSYFGIVDLAGFPKDRYYLYQARWRPDLPMAHILPHWNWPDRAGLVTPVHVYTSGDSAEIFLNGESLGKKTRGRFEYRLRWDEVKYQPGELTVIAYKNGKPWATETMKTTGPAAKLALSADRSRIKADGQDLSFITLRITDADGLTVPRADNLVTFSIEGPGEIVATDNGDPTSFVPFRSHRRPAFNGLALVIVRAKKGQSGSVTVTAAADGLTAAAATITASDRGVF
ncbi:MAG: DUF4982 domain-containing protein [Planctomycetales bacterium]|nr:DUF4982 domain-containing protein [Planctomycetales bacterium]